MENNEELASEALFVGPICFGKKVILVGVSKLWPMSQTWTTACFCIAYKLRMVFLFVSGWKKRVIHSDVKIIYKCPYIINFWNIAIFSFTCCLWLLLLYRFSSCNRNYCLQILKYLLSGLFQKAIVRGLVTLNIKCSGRKRMSRLDVRCDCRIRIQRLDSG